MVVRERFGRPILTDADLKNQTHEVETPAETLNDTTVYPDGAEEGTTKPTAGDAMEVIAQDRALTEAEERLDRVLDEAFKEIADEHAAAHRVTS